MNTINKLIVRNILRYSKTNDDYECACGSYLLKTSVETHLKTVKHRAAMKNKRLRNSEMRFFTYSTTYDDYTCMCGSHIQKSSVKTHLRSDKHVTYVKSICN